MLRRLAAFARAHLLWIILLALFSSAAYLWLHLDEYLYVDLHAMAMLPDIETTPAAAPVASNTRRPAAPCNGVAHQAAAPCSPTAACTAQ
jgi:hypothetical protein